MNVETGIRTGPTVIRLLGVDRYPQSGELARFLVRMLTTSTAVQLAREISNSSDGFIPTPSAGLDSTTE